MNPRTRSSYKTNMDRPLFVFCYDFNVASSLQCDVIMMLAGKIRRKEVIKKSGQVRLLRLHGDYEQQQIAVEVPDKFNGKPTFWIHFNMKDAEEEYDRYVKFFSKEK